MSLKKKLLDTLRYLEEKLGYLPHGLTLQKVYDRVGEEDIWEEAGRLYFKIERHPWIEPPIYFNEGPSPLFEIREVVYAVDPSLSDEKAVEILSDKLMGIGYDPELWAMYFIDTYFGETEYEISDLDEAIKDVESYLDESLVNIYSDELEREKLESIKRDLILELRRQLIERASSSDTEK